MEEDKFIRKSPFTSPLKKFSSSPKTCSAINVRLELNLAPPHDNLHRALFFLDIISNDGAEGLFEGHMQSDGNSNWIMVLNSCFVMFSQSSAF